MNAPVVLIHGTSAGPWTMANFRTHCETLGWECHSPAYRHHDKPPSEESSRLLVGLSIADYVEDVAEAVAKLDARPILVGHSLSGVVAQKLAARGAAASHVPEPRNARSAQARQFFDDLVCRTLPTIAPVIGDRSGVSIIAQRRARISHKGHQIAIVARIPHRRIDALIRQQPADNEVLNAEIAQHIMDVCRDEDR